MRGFTRKTGALLVLSMILATLVVVAWPAPSALAVTCSGTTNPHINHKRNGPGASDLTMTGAKADIQAEKARQFCTGGSSWSYAYVMLFGGCKAPYSGSTWYAQTGIYDSTGNTDPSDPDPGFHFAWAFKGCGQNQLPTAYFGGTPVVNAVYRFRVMIDKLGTAGDNCNTGDICIQSDFDNNGDYSTQFTATGYYGDTATQIPEFAEEASFTQTAYLGTVAEHTDFTLCKMRRDNSETYIQTDFGATSGGLDIWDEYEQGSGAWTDSAENHVKMWDTRF